MREEPPRPTYATRARRQVVTGRSPGGATRAGCMVLGISFLGFLFWLLQDVLALMGHPHALNRFTPALIAAIIFIFAGSAGLHLTSRNVLASLFDFGLAGLYLFAWLAPEALGENHLRYLFWLVSVEFIAITCALAVETFFKEKSTWNQLKLLGFIFGLLGASVLISYLAGHWWPLAAVAILGANQVVSSLADRGVGRTSDWPVPSWFLRWLIFVVLYWILSRFELHRLGWTDFHFTIVDQERFSAHNVIAFGFYYFLSAGLYELTRQVHPHRPRHASQPTPTS